SRVEESYLNQDYYQKGLAKEKIERDRFSRIFGRQITLYQPPPDALRPPDALEPATERFARHFPAELESTTFTYQGATTDSSGPYKFPQQSRGIPAGQPGAGGPGYDAVGNLLFMKDLGDETTSLDDVQYAIGYLHDDAQHVFRPKEVKATDSSGVKLRDRLATYEPHGALATVTNVVVGGK